MLEPRILMERRSTPDSIRCHLSLRRRASIFLLAGDKSDIFLLAGDNTHFHSFVYLVFHFRHTTKNQRGKPASVNSMAIMTAPRTAQNSHAAEFCSGPLKSILFHIGDRAKGCLHLPGTKWCGLHPDNGTECAWRRRAGRCHSGFDPPANLIHADQIR